MSAHSIAKKELNYNGSLIHEKADKLSLTDMWKASGSPNDKRPSEWLRHDGTIEFIEALSASNMGTAHIKTIKGNGGGTWAHWQIALAYAKYLSPEFHMWCNQVVRAHMEERSVATATNLTRYDTAIIGNVVKNCAGVVLREQLEQMLPSIIESVAQMVKPQQPVVIIQGRTAGEILKSNGFSGVKGLAVWFGNRLQTFGCRVDDNGSGYLGVSSARLFDPNKSELYLKNGGKSAIRLKVAERQGQKTLRLVRKEGE